MPVFMHPRSNLFLKVERLKDIPLSSCLNIFATGFWFQYILGDGIRSSVFCLLALTVG